MPNPDFQPTGLGAGPDGNLWTAYWSSYTSISRISPTGEFHDFTVPYCNGLQTPAVAPDGTVWFTCEHNVYRMSSDGAVVDMVATTYPLGWAGQIIAGPDGNMWVADSNGYYIFVITPSGQLTAFTVPNKDGYSHNIELATGPDGNVWFADDTNQVGKVTPSGVFTMYDAPPTQFTGPTQITAGPDGNMWYTQLVDSNGANQVIGKVTPDGTFTQYFLPVGVTPSSITTGPDGALWFTSSDWSTGSGQVGRITTDGHVGLASTPAGSTGGARYNNYITAGADGRLWMVMWSPYSVAAFPPFVPTPSQPDLGTLTPPDGSATGGSTVLITGYDVGSATRVLFGDTPATSFTRIGPGQVQAVVPPHAPGIVNVTVVTPDGTTQPSAGSTFYISSADCGKAVTRNTTLHADIGPCYRDGVVVSADGVTLRLAGHRIFGFPGPSDGGHSVGVRLEGRSNVKVIGGTVTGFDAGVVIRGGRSNSVSGLTVTDNIGPDNVITAEFGDGILILGSSGNKITGNTVSHNGKFDGIGVFDPGADGNTIAGNVVENTVGPPNHGPSGEGIIVNGSSGVDVSTFVSGNKITGNTVRNNASGGISDTNHVNGVIADNTVIGNGTSNGFGNGIGVTVGFNWNLGPTNDVVTHNAVHGNGVDGIRVGGLTGYASGVATGNSIQDNNASNNAKHPEVDGIEGSPQGFDLDELDSTPGCQNTWFGNTWGAAFYTPDCTASGGKGPTPPAAAAPLQPATAGPMTGSPSSHAANTAPTDDPWWAFLQRGR